MLTDWYSVPGSLSVMSAFGIEDPQVLCPMGPWGTKVMFMKILTAMLCLCDVFECLIQRYLSLFFLSKQLNFWPMSVVHLEWWSCPICTKVKPRSHWFEHHSLKGWSFLRPTPVDGCRSFWFNQIVHGSGLSFCPTPLQWNSQVAFYNLDALYLWQLCLLAFPQESAQDPVRPESLTLPSAELAADVLSLKWLGTLISEMESTITV